MIRRNMFSRVLTVCATVTQAATLCGCGDGRDGDSPIEVVSGPISPEDLNRPDVAAAVVTAPAFPSAPALSAADVAEPVFQFGHVDVLTCVQLSADSRYLLTGARDGLAFLWDIETRRILRSFHGHVGAISSMVMTQAGSRLITGSHDGSAIMWNLETAELLKVYECGSSFISALAISADETRLIAGTIQGEFIIWDLATGEVLQAIEGVGAHVQDVAMNRDASLAYVGVAGGNVIIWDVVKEKVIQVASEESARLRTLLTAAAASPDGSLLATATMEHKIILWDAPTGKVRRTLNGHTAAIMGLRFSSDGNRLWTSSWDRSCREWDVQSGDVVRVLPKHTAALSSVAISQDGDLAAAGSIDGSAIVWEIESKRQLQVFESHTISGEWMAVVDQGKRLVVRSRDARRAIGWDLTTGTRDESVEFNALTMSRIVSLADDVGVAVTDYSNETPLFETENTVVVRDPQTNREIRKFEEHSGNISAISVSTGRPLALTGDDDKVAVLWNTETGELISRLDDFSVEIAATALNHDASVGVTADGMSIIVWKFPGGDKVHELRMEPDHEADGVTDVEFSPDGSMVAAATLYGRVAIWNAETGEQLPLTVQAPMSITGIAFSRDGRRLMTMSTANGLEFWDITQGVWLARLVLLEDGDWLIYTLDGLFDGSPAGLEFVALRQAGTNTLVRPEPHFAKYHVPGLLAKVFAGEELPAPPYAGAESE